MPTIEKYPDIEKLPKNSHLRSVGCAVCACLFALRLLAKADSPTPKLNVAASKIWRDKCFLTKLTFWEALQ